MCYSSFPSVVCQSSNVSVCQVLNDMPSPIIAVISLGTNFTLNETDLTYQLKLVVLIIQIFKTYMYSLNVQCSVGKQSQNLIVYHNGAIITSIYKNTEKITNQQSSNSPSTLLISQNIKIEINYFIN